MKKYIYVSIGCAGMILGAIGAVLPVLPTVPFLMLAACCFAKSSDRMNRWFRNTKLYKNNLEDYVEGRGMTWKCKIRVMVMVMVTILMSLGFVMMGSKGVVMGCAVLGIVWILHIAYFCFGVKTIK